MTKKPSSHWFVLPLWLLLWSAITVPTHGKVIEKQAFPSKLLGRSVAYAIYLPPDYETSKRWYPVVYLLHGFSDDESAWIQYGEVQMTADRAIESGQLPPMIIVMPDAGVSWYMNSQDGKIRYEDMFVQELLPYIESEYRIRPEKEFRAVAGLSMGGHGALLFAMKYPDLFSSCAALSAGIFSIQELTEMPAERFLRLLGPVLGPDIKTGDRLAHWKANSPLELAGSLPVDELKKVRYYFDCGDDDFLYRGNTAIHVVLRNREIPHEFRMRDGAHSWEYWRTGIGDALRFIGQAFHR